MDFTPVLRSVYADSLDGIVVADADTVVLDCNPAYAQLTGYTRAELIGRRTNVIRSGLTAPAAFARMWHDLSHRASGSGRSLIAARTAQSGSPTSLSPGS